jgi:AraC-like DNA-binding protein
VTLSSENNAISDMLAALRISATRLTVAHFKAPWGIKSEAFAPAFLYAVLEGGFQFDTPNVQPVTVKAGDILLLNGPLAHRTYSCPLARITPLHELWSDRGLPRWSESRNPERIIKLMLGDEGEVTRMASMVIEVEPGWGRSFMAGLPPYVHLAAGAQEENDWLKTFVAALANHESTSSPGQVAILLRLAEILFISVLANHLSKGGPMEGWCRALVDSQLSQVISAVGRAPGENWTLEAMARVAGMSRSSFTSRFASVTGSTPHSFVIGWRMRLAEDLLRTNRFSAKEISKQLGYANPSVFGAAFRKQYGLSPAQFARRELTGDDPVKGVARQFLGGD